MTRIPRNVKQKVFKPIEKIGKKINPITEKLVKSPNKLEKTPTKDVFFYDVFTDEACFDSEKAERLFNYGMNFLRH